MSSKAGYSVEYYSSRTYKFIFKGNIQYIKVRMALDFICEKFDEIYSTLK